MFQAACFYIGINRFKLISLFTENIDYEENLTEICQFTGLYFSTERYVRKRLQNINPRPSSQKKEKNI